MDEFFSLKAFERGDYINEEDVPNVIKYICGHLNSWSPNCSYFER